MVTNSDEDQVFPDHGSPLETFDSIVKTSRCRPNLGAFMESPAPPVPVRNPLSAFFWDGAMERRLLIQRCNHCGTYIHLPRPICRRCQSFDLSPSQVSGRATLYSFTVTHKAFHPYFVERTPYMVASVELVEQPGLLVLTNLVGVDESDVRIGMDLQVTFEPLGPDQLIPVFMPAGRPVGVTAEVTV